MNTKIGIAGTGKLPRKTETLLVSFDFVEKDRNAGVLVVGWKRVNRDSIDVINAFYGEEARELYDKLVCKKGD